MKVLAVTSIAAVVVLLSGGGVFLATHGKKGTSEPLPPQSTVAAPTPNPKPTPALTQPSSVTPPQTEPTAPDEAAVESSKPATTASVAPAPKPSRTPPPSAATAAMPRTESPAIAAAPSIEPAAISPAARPHSGTLRYSGPPVQPGETISFHGLPGGMLRFSFDHANWQPRIVHDADGSQTLLLRAIGVATKNDCVVQWSTPE